MWIARGWCRLGAVAITAFAVGGCVSDDASESSDAEAGAAADSGVDGGTPVATDSSGNGSAQPDTTDAGSGSAHAADGEGLVPDAADGRGLAPEAGAIDAVFDATTDPGTTDAGMVNVGTTDAGAIDPGTADAGMIDAGTTNVGTTDAGAIDAATVDAAIAAGPAAVSGAVAKGPFVLGSSVVVYPVDSTGHPLGPSFPTTTTDGIGDFAVTVPSPGPVLLTATGYYFDEIEHAVSTCTLALDAFADLSSGPQQVYVNPITDLSHARITTLLGQGESLDCAMAQAEHELEKDLAIGGSGFDPGARANQLNAVGASNRGDAYALAVGAVVAEIGHQATTDAGAPGAAIQSFLSNTANELAPAGALGATTTSTVASAQTCVEPDDVTSAMTTYLASAAPGNGIPDINLALDSDLDGVPNALDTCPLVANPSQEPVQSVCAYRHTVANAGAYQGQVFAVGDLNGDQRPDIVNVGQGGASNSPGVGDVVAVLNDGSGGFGSPITSTNVFPSGPQLFLEPNAVIADMNGDGNPDVVAVIENTHDCPTLDCAFGVIFGFSYAPGDGAGHFGPAVPLFADQDFPTNAEIRVVDLNGDQRPDIVMPKRGGLFVALAPASGSWPGLKELALGKYDAGGSSTPDVEGFTAMHGEQFTVGDVNGDQIPDIVAVGVGSPTGLFTLLGNGDGTFTTYGPEPVGTAPFDVRIGDVDGDGFTDVIVASAPSTEGAPNTITVRFGQNTATPVATFSTSSLFPPQNAGCPIASGIDPGSSWLPFEVADVTGDGKADVVIGMSSVLVSNGRTLAAPVAVQSYQGTLANFNSSWFWLGDLNGDQKGDIVAAVTSTTVTGGIQATLLNPPGIKGW